MIYQNLGLLDTLIIRGDICISASLVQKVGMRPLCG